MLYNPSPFVAATRVIPVLALVAVIVTPGMTASA